MRPRLYDVLRKQIDRSVVRHHIHAVENRLMDTWDRFFDLTVRERVDELEWSRFSVRNVEAIKPQTLLPFLIFDPFRNPFQRPPCRGQRDMQFRLCIRLDEELVGGGIVLPQREMVTRRWTDI